MHPKCLVLLSGTAQTLMVSHSPCLCPLPWAEPCLSLPVGYRLESRLDLVLGLSHSLDTLMPAFLGVSWVSTSDRWVGML